MTAPLSRDLRERIIRAVAEGSSIRQAAERFAVSPSAAVKLMQRVRQTGSTSPAKIGGRRRQLLEPYADLLREMVLAKKEITLREIKAVLAARGVEVKALSTIADMFHRLDRSHKKELEGQRAGSARCRPAPQPLAGVAALHGCRTLCVSGRDGAPTAMTRLRGWGPRGERLVDSAPYGHWKTTTFVAGLRNDGVIAPCRLDGPMTGEVFRAYVEQMLAPSLRAGDVVVMDNLPAHKGAGVRQAITAVGASLLYQPSYSPDLNPIEQLFATLKALLRKVAARTRGALWTTIGTLLDAFTPAECRNYIANSGYEFV